MCVMLASFPLSIIARVCVYARTQLRVCVCEREPVRLRIRVGLCAGVCAIGRIKPARTKASVFRT